MLGSDAVSDGIEPIFGFLIRAPYGAQCMGYAIRTWSAICLVVPHLRCDERALIQKSHEDEKKVIHFRLNKKLYPNFNC